MKYLVLICTVLSIFCGAAETPPKKKKTICLNMIVKNESQVIEKCLNSVKPLIDYWVIVDTGSTDNTQEIVKKCLQGIPGKLYSRRWKDYAYNRNEALSLAKNKGDYVLLIDADEVLQCADDFTLPALEKDLYFIPVREIGLMDFKRNGLISTRLQWKWEGIIHEVIRCPEMKSTEILKGIVNLSGTHRKAGSDQALVAKYLGHAEILEKALKEEPTNSRYMFYLGTSYVAAKKPVLAKKSFEKRVQMPSTDLQETFMAFYYLGCLEEESKEFEAALRNYSKAYALRPTRAEPLLRSAIIHRMRGHLLQGYQLIKHASLLPFPTEDASVFYAAYDHEILIEWANISMQLGNYQEGLEACNKLLANPHLAPDYRSVVQHNVDQATKKLAEKVNLLK